VVWKVSWIGFFDLPTAVHANLLLIVVVVVVVVEFINRFITSWM